MKSLPKYIPLLILAAGLFFAGRWTASEDTGELEKLREERDMIEQGIIHKEALLTAKDKVIATIRKEKREDSLQALSAVKAEIKAKLYYKRLYEQINLSGTSIPALDSLRAALRSPLHTH